MTYVVFGDLKSSSKRLLVALHGVPGLLHSYLVPHKSLYTQAWYSLGTRSSIPVVLYDQIGNGLSSHIDDAPKEFWKPDLFMDELDNLLQYLGIQHDFDLLGQSWGGKLAAEYAARRNPLCSKHLIIANATASAALMMKGVNELLDKLPGEVAEIVRKHELKGSLDNAEYQTVLKVFQKKHICGLDPLPTCLTESFEESQKDPTVYLALSGEHTSSK